MIRNKKAPMNQMIISGRARCMVKDYTLTLINEIDFCRTTANTTC